MRVFIFVFFLFATLFLHAQNIFEGYNNLFTSVRHYTVYQTISEINIDGKSDEISWKNAAWSEYFKDIEGDIKPEPTFYTHFKMLWDEQNLYILAELEEQHIWAYYTQRDQIVYHENDFEIFIDPNGDSHQYFEFELNAQNTIFDLYMPKAYRNGGRFNIEWNAAGFKSAVSVDGTINNPSDVDKKWTLEMAIPFSSLQINNEYFVPEDGDYWKINFSRVQWQTEIVNGKYQKRKDPKTGRFLSENNWVWSPQGIVNMHYPERWGIAAFSAKPLNSDKLAFSYPEDEKLAKYLWLIYYKQHNFKKENGKYAGSLAEIELKERTTTDFGETIHLNLESNETGFVAILENEKGLKLSINQDGLFEKLNK